MNKDKYLVVKANEYAIKISSIFDKRFDRRIFEYYHSLLTEKQIGELNSYALKEFTSFASKATKIKTKSGPRNNRSLQIIKIDKNFLQDFASDLHESLFEKDDWSRMIEKIYLNHKATYNNLVAKILEMLEKNANKVVSNSVFLKNLKTIKHVFKLDDNETEILTFMFLIENDNAISSLFNEDIIEMDDMIKSLRLYCRFFNVSPREMRDYLAKDSKLVKTGILSKDRKWLEASDCIQQYLAGISRMDLIDNFLTQGSVDGALALEDHIVPEKNVTSMLSLLRSKKGCNLLLHGKPGTGKTEFAKSLAAKVDMPIYFINQYDEEGEEDLSHRKSAIIAASNILSQKSIIVVDECDPIISTADNMWMCEEPKSKNDSKAWVNGLLEKSTHKIIWITNKINSIDSSTKRRFSFSQEFSNLTKKQRLKVWETVAEKHQVNFLTQSEMSELASRYKVNAGGIALAIQDINSMKSIRKMSDKKVILENILKQHEKFVFGSISKLATKSSSYDSNILNLDIDSEEIVSKLKMFIDYKTKNPLSSEIPNMNLLFYGPPGTGKTEFVKHLGEKLAMEIDLKRLSDIKSKWYGESLQNIAAMFGSAEESNKILFLDEADSFFVDRENSTNEYHLEETNELLTQMENFKGILICSTNMFGNLDQAVMRRFALKVSFGYLNDSGKEKLFQKVFAENFNGKIDEVQLKRLREIKHLTPGDFKVVKQKHFFSSDVSSERLIDDLLKESGMKKVNVKRISL